MGQVQDRGIRAQALAMMAGLAFASPLFGQCMTFNFARGGGQVSISGATLMAPFFQSPASTNDWIDANGNGCTGTLCTPTPEQLAPIFDGITAPEIVFFEVQYRGVGSVNGLREFTAWHLCNLFNKSVPSEIGLLNGYQWAAGGVKTGGNPAAGCDYLLADPDGDGWVLAGADGITTNDPGTLSALNGIDIAILDVPSSWAVRESGSPTWSLNPTEPGYGGNPAPSADAPTYFSKLPTLCRDCPNGSGALGLDCDPLVNPDCICLNTAIRTPDSNTVFDNEVSWVPIVPIANRGVGRSGFSISEYQHLFVTGRLPNGENLVVATRSIGSGTRNGIMNTMGIDPSYGMGDNVSAEWTSTSQGYVGPNHKTSNAASSSNIEESVKQSRLAIGYSGLAGQGRAAEDAQNGLYEILDVTFDDAGGTIPVRPTIEAALVNCDPNTGFRLGGFATLVTRGSIDQEDPSAPEYMSNQVARIYVSNIYAAINDYKGEPLPANQSDWSPGHYLIANFTLREGMDCIPSAEDPTVFVPNINFNPSIQETSLASTLTVTPNYGSVNPAGLVPRRVTAGQPYADETAAGVNNAFEGAVKYSYKLSSGALATFGLDAANPSQDNDGDGIPCGLDPNESCTLADRRLSARNSVTGDFNNDGARNAEDISAMMQAAFAPLDFELDIVPSGGWGGDLGQMPEDVVIVHVLGDFDGNGQFDVKDVRYFADGLAIVPGTDSTHLDRKAGFTAVDEAWYVLTGNDNNFFNTVVKDPAGVPTGVYAPGDSRGDIAGNTAQAGAAPTGANGVVDCADVLYVAANFGAFSDLDQTVNLSGNKRLDLSADMDGNLVIDCADVAEVLAMMGVSNLQACGAIAACVPQCPADLNQDGTVNGADLALILGNWSTDGGTTGADLDGSGNVDGTDLAIVLGNWGNCL